MDQNQLWPSFWTIWAIHNSVNVYIVFWFLLFWLLKLLFIKLKLKISFLCFKWSQTIYVLFYCLPCCIAAKECFCLNLDKILVTKIYCILNWFSEALFKYCSEITTTQNKHSIYIEVSMSLSSSKALIKWFLNAIAVWYVGRHVNYTE